MDHDANDRVSLTKKAFQNGETLDQTKYYHMTKHIANNLSMNENRTYSEAEEATGAYKKAEVILAFPLTHDSIPIIEPQEVFAFLPVRHMGFTVKWLSLKSLNTNLTILSVLDSDGFRHPGKPTGHCDILG